MNPSDNTNQIRLLAECLAKQVPSRSADDNWALAEKAFLQRPWRPWVIRFCGDKERSGWDWAELFLKISVPVLILALTSAYNQISQASLARSSKEQKENQVINEFLAQMRSIIITADSNDSMGDQRVRGVARGLTLATLSQVSSPARKRLIIRYLVDSGLTWPEGRLFSLGESDLSHANLSQINLASVDFSKAKLRNADFRDSTLSRARFFGSDLVKARLEKTSLIGASFASSDLSSANLSDSLLSDANLRSAKLWNANLNKAALFGSDLSGADLRNATLVNATLNGANLSKANLYGASLRSADLAKPYFEQFDLSATQQNVLSKNFKATLLVDANLGNADLSKADLRGAVLAGANLRGATLSDVKWNSDTIWPGPANFDGSRNVSPSLASHIGIR